MSTHKVPIVVIDEIIAHPDSETKNLEIAKISGWECVIRKGQFRKGDMCVYVPVDSILPLELERKIFPEGSKIKLNKSRIRSIKIRGYVSQGLLLTPQELELKNYFEGQDLMEALNIKKYEPPEQSVPRQMQIKTSRKHVNKNFHQYSDLQNWKWYSRSFDGEECVITLKMHGTNFRAGWVPRAPRTLLGRVLMWLGVLSKWEFCWGSRRVQIQGKLFHKYKGYYSEDVYTKMVKQYNLKKIIPKGYVIYGEIVGDGIQKGYTYGCRPGEHKLYVFDIMKDGKYLNWKDFDIFCIMFISPPVNNVPILYTGPYSEQKLIECRDGAPMFEGEPVREGCVIKPVVEKEDVMGRKILKCINPEYYLRDDETDFH